VPEPAKAAASPGGAVREVGVRNYVVNKQAARQQAAAEAGRPPPATPRGPASRACPFEVRVACEYCVTFKMEAGFDEGLLSLSLPPSRLYGESL
jgi:hypothetical protein